MELMGISDKRNKKRQLLEGATSRNYKKKKKSKTGLDKVEGASRKVMLKGQSGHMTRF